MPDLEATLRSAARVEAGLRASAAQHAASAAAAARDAEHLAAENAALRAELNRLARDHSLRIGRAEALHEGERMASAQAIVQARAELAEAVSQRDAIVRGYTNSTSWKLTRPLRVLVRLLRGGPSALGWPRRVDPPAAVLAASPVPSPASSMDTSLKTAMRNRLQVRLYTFLSDGETLAFAEASRPEVSIVLVLYNQAELTLACLEAIVATAANGPSFEVVIVDNASTDMTGLLLSRVSGATVIRNAGNVHFLRAVNQAGGAVRGEAMLLLNNDAQVAPGAVRAALATLRSATDIGAVGARIVLPDGSLQEAGSIIWRDGTCAGFGRGHAPEAEAYRSRRDADFCSGAFLLTWTSLWHAMGGFDEVYVPAYYEEVDYCVRLWRAGFRVVYEPGATILHYEFASSAKAEDALALQATNHRIFRERHAPWLAGRPERSAAPALPPPPGKPPGVVNEVPNSRPVQSDFAVAVPFGFAPSGQAHPRIAVLCHLFYEELGGELLGYLAALPDGADVFISTDTAAKRHAIEAVFAGWDKGRVEVRLMPNRGRDIAPKIVGFADVWPNYGLVLCLHTKKSDHSGFLAPWRRFLFENLLGSPAVVASILDAFARQPSLGMVAPLHYEGIRRWIGWHGNYDLAAGLAGRMGIALSPGRAIDFPSGSMFWARPAALQPLLDLRLSLEDFAPEAGQQDHTVAHAIERLFFFVCERSGHRWLKVADPRLYHDTGAVAALDDPVDLERAIREHGAVLTGQHPVAIRPEPAPLMRSVPPGLVARLASREARTRSAWERGPPPPSASPRPPP